MGGTTPIPIDILNKLVDKLEESMEKTKNSLTREQAERIIAEVVSGEMAQLEKVYRDHGERKISFAPGSPSSSDFYQKLFGRAASPAAPKAEGWEDFYGFVKALVRRVNSDDMTKALSEGESSDGGALVPEEFAAEIFNVAAEEAVTLLRVRSYGMGSDTKKIPGVVLGDHSTNLFGGMIGYWTGEGKELTEADPKYRSLELKASKLTVFGKASSEWSEDAVGGREGLKNMMGQALGWYLDDAFINGTGAGQPLGVMNSPCLITQAKDSGQDADTITYSNLTKMVSRLHPASLKRSIWVAHPSTLPQLFAIAATVQTSGPGIITPGVESGVILAITPSIGSDGFNLLTRPLILSEKMQPIGDKGDIMLADFSQYGVGMRKDLRLEASTDMYFKTDEIAHRGIIRVDGQPLWDDVLTLKDGTHTVSPFIVLAERA